MPKGVKLPPVYQPVKAIQTPVPASPIVKAPAASSRHPKPIRDTPKPVKPKKV